MAARALPGLGLMGFRPLGEDGWKDEMDLNLLTISVLLNRGVLSTESTTPGSPSEGDIYIFDATHATQPNKVAVYDNATWKYLTPNAGWSLYDIDADADMRFDGTAWANFPVS